MKLLHYILTAANFVNPFFLWRDLGAETSVRNSDTLPRSPPSKRIAVVGGGTSGLSFLKVSKEYQKKYNLSWEVILYEQRHDIGGIWLEQEVKPEPPIVPETPLYPHLRTNSPHAYNTHPHFPFPPELNLYPGSGPVHQYHKAVAEHYDLRDAIHLRHNVTSARWIGDARDGHWQLAIQRPLTHPTIQEQRVSRLWGSRSPLPAEDTGIETISRAFDHLIVAVGQNHYPRIDDFPGKDAWVSHRNLGSPFKRDIQHSVYFMGPEPYINRTVLIVGGGISGIDIGDIIGPFAAKVYVARSSWRKGDPEWKKPRAFSIPKPRLSNFTREAIYFEDGSSVTDIDSVILATGYAQIIPFLSAGNSLTVDPQAKSRNTSHIYPPLDLPLTTNNKYIRPLYKHTMSLSSYFPPTSLFILGLPRIVPAALSGAAQSIFATHTIADPSLVGDRIALLRELEEEEELIRRAGFDPDHQAHRLFDQDGDSQHENKYMDALLGFLTQRNVSGLPLLGSGGRYVEDWRRRTGNLPTLAKMLHTWRELEQRGEVQKLLIGRRTEKDWVELLDYLIAHPLPHTISRATSGD